MSGRGSCQIAEFNKRVAEFSISSPYVLSFRETVRGSVSELVSLLVSESVTFTNKN